MVDTKRISIFAPKCFTTFETLKNEGGEMINIP